MQLTSCWPGAVVNNNRKVDFGSYVAGAECNRKPFGSSQELKGFNDNKREHTFLNHHLTIGNSNLEEGSSKKFENGPACRGPLAHIGFHD
eukprot:scaffold5675_cov112-Skeletonema_dohrnii-CCMP3373.AAC.2